MRNTKIIVLVRKVYYNFIYFTYVNMPLRVTVPDEVNLQKLSLVLRLDAENVNFYRYPTSPMDTNNIRSIREPIKEERCKSVVTNTCTTFERIFSDMAFKNFNTKN
jgi:hypothetical protein